MFNNNTSLEYKFTSPIRQLLSYYWVYILNRPCFYLCCYCSCVTSNCPWSCSDHCIFALLGYLVGRPQASIGYSPGTISFTPEVVTSRNSRDGSQGVTNWTPYQTNHFGSIHSVLKLSVIMSQVSGSNKGKVPTRNPPTNTPDLDDDEDVALLKRQILELKSALNKQANYI
jgi:hypothetical protein